MLSDEQTCNVALAFILDVKKITFAFCLIQRRGLKEDQAGDSSGSLKTIKFHHVLQSDPGVVRVENFEGIFKCVQRGIIR